MMMFLYAGDTGIIRKSLPEIFTSSIKMSYTGNIFIDNAT
jgi:hypothetical protein